FYFCSASKDTSNFVMRLWSRLLPLQGAIKLLFETRHETVRAEWTACALGLSDRCISLRRRLLGQKRRPVGREIEQGLHNAKLVVAARKMRPGAGKAPIACFARKSRANGIELDIARAGLEMALIHGKGGKTPLPEIASPALAKIDVPRITPMG